MIIDKKDLIKRISAGAFLLAGLFITIIFILTLGRDKGISQPKFYVPVLFKNVGGIIEGAPTRLSGVKVGSVASIDFLEEEIRGRRVKVTLAILEKYRSQLDQSARFAIKTEGILGEKLVEIYIDGNDGALDLNAPIFGIDPIDVQDLAPIFITAAESFTKTSEELSKINMVELAQIMQESSEALLITAQGLNSIMAELQSIARKAKRLIDRVEEKVIEGDLFKVF